MNWIEMLFLGDSLTAGSRDPFGLCWPIYMAQIAKKEAVVLPDIEAKDGRTSSQLVRLALDKLRASPAKEVFVLIGTNDAKDEINTPLQLYLGNVGLIVEWCNVLGKRPYVMTIPLPLGFGSPGYTRKALDRIKEYNRGLHELMSGQSDAIVECENIRKFTDGIHLTPEGAMEIASRAWRKVRERRTFI